MGANHEHRVCTYQEAEAAVRKHRAFYMNNCFCRTSAKRGEWNIKYCGHPLDGCITFRRWLKGEKARKWRLRKVTFRQVLAAMEDWKRQHHFFRFMGGEGAICRCCACGCGLFFNEQGKHVKDKCGKSPFIEKTDVQACNLCRRCIKACAYQARAIVGGKMKVTRAKCYGCSACEYACQKGAITMVRRPARRAAGPH